MGSFNPMAALPQLAGMFTDIMGGFADSRQRGWENSARINVLEELKRQMGWGQDRFGDIFNPFRDQLLDNANRSGQMFWGGEGGPGAATGLQDDLMAFGPQLAQMFQQSGMTPGMQNSLGAMGDVRGGYAPTGQLAQQLFAGGGWTPQGQQIFDQGFGIASGQGQGMNVQQMVGQDLLSQHGGNPWNQQLAGAGQSALGGAFGVGGLTPTGAVGEGVALEGMLQGGGTNLTDSLQSRGAELANEDALIPMELAVSMAREGAEGDLSKRAESMRRQALARGGGPGAVVASGAANQGLADFATEGHQAVSAAQRDAMLKQQELQLRQQGQGAQMGLQAGGLEANRLGQFGDMLQGLEGVASQRFGQGGGMLSNADQSAQGWTGLGGQLQNQFTQNQLGGLNSMINQLGNQNQYALGGGQLAGQFMNNEANLLSQIFGGQMGAEQLGLNRASGQSGAQNQLFGQRGQSADRFAQMILGGYNPMTSLSGQTLGYAGNAMQGMPGMFGPQRSQPVNTSGWGGTLGQ